MRKLTYMALACAVLVSSPAASMATRKIDPSTVPVSAADRQAWVSYRDKVNNSIIAKNAWQDPEYYYWDKAARGATMAINVTNNQVFQIEQAAARAIGDRICGRMGGCINP